MILSEITEAVAGCLEDLGYDTHDGPPPQFLPPAAVIELPSEIVYHETMARTERLTLTVTVVVSRADAKDARQRLYAAMSTEETPGVDVVPIQPAIEACSGPWKSIVVTSSSAIGSVPLGTSSANNGLAGQFVVEIRTIQSIPGETS